MPSGSFGSDPSYGPSSRCGSAPITRMSAYGISLQSRSGGGGGMQTSGYDGSQLPCGGGCVGTGGGTVGCGTAVAVGRGEGSGVGEGRSGAGVAVGML